MRPHRLNLVRLRPRSPARCHLAAQRSRQDIRRKSTRPCTHRGSVRQSRPIKWVVPYPAGGITDMVTRGDREDAGRARPAGGVENKPGANWILGADLVAKAAPDGYTFLTVIAAHAANATLYAGKLPFDAVKSFAPVSLVGDRAADHDREQRPPGQGRQGTDRLRQGESRQGLLRFLRRRRGGAPDHGAASSRPPASTWSTSRTRARRRRCRT